MKKFAKIIALSVMVIFSTVLLTGCWDLIELNSLGIVTGIGLDAAENKDEINLILQVGITGQSTSSGNSSSNSGSTSKDTFINYEAMDKTYFSALSKIKQKMSRTPFLHDNQITVFGREQVERGIAPYLDIFYREKDNRLEVWMVMADTTAKDILEAKIGPEKISALTLSNIIDNTAKVSTNLATNFYNFLKGYIEPTTCLLMPIVKLVKTETAEEYENSSMAVLKNTKLIGELDSNLIDGYLWVKGDIKQKEISFQTEDKSVDLKLSKIKIKNTPTIEKDGTLCVQIDLKSKAIINSIQGFQNEQIDNYEKYFEGLATDKINKQISDCLLYVQSINADIYGIGTMYHKKMPKYWKTIEKDWDSIFPTIKFKTNIEVDIIADGSIDGGILKEKLK